MKNKRTMTPLMDTTPPKKTRAGRFHDLLRSRGLIMCLNPCVTKAHNLVAWEKEFALLEQELMATFNIEIDEARSQVNDTLDVYAKKYGIIEYLPKAFNAKDFRLKYIAIRAKLIEKGCIEETEQLMGDYIEPQLEVIRVKNPDGTVTLRFKEESA